MHHERLHAFVIEKDTDLPPEEDAYIQDMITQTDRDIEDARETE